jgi:capsule polysaccharide export protein KpsE/RkpR
MGKLNCKEIFEKMKNGENSLTQFNNKNGIFKPLSARDFDESGVKHNKSNQIKFLTVLDK